MPSKLKSHHINNKNGKTNRKKKRMQSFQWGGRQVQTMASHTREAPQKAKPGWHGGTPQAPHPPQVADEGAEGGEGVAEEHRPRPKGPAESPLEVGNGRKSGHVWIIGRQSTVGDRKARRPLGVSGMCPSTALNDLDETVHPYVSLTTKEKRLEHSSGRQST